MAQWVIRLSTAIILILLIHSKVFALPFFGTGTTATTTATPPAKPSPTHVMSAEEFSNRVNTLNQQTTANLAQQVSASLPKKTPEAQSNTSHTNSGSAAIPQPPSGVETPSTSAIQPPAAAGTNPIRPLPTPNTNTNTTVFAPPASATQPYTGFGTGNTNNTSNTAPTAPKSSSSNTGGSNTGGWNIKY